MRRVVALLAVPLLALGACGAGERENEGVVPTLPADAGVRETEAGTVPAATAGEEGNGEVTGSGDEAGGPPGRGPVDPDALFGTRPDAGGPDGTLRDGVWGIGPAGEIEFSVTGPDSLLVEGIRPADGWVVVEQEVSDAELDLRLRRGPVTFQAQAEIDEGTLEVRIDQDIAPARPGTFFVGEAATVTVAVQGGSLVLGAVLVADGWVETDRDVDSDDIELDFQRAGAGVVELWEFTADLDDGVLEVRIDHEISGPYAG